MAGSKDKTKDEPDRICRNKTPIHLADGRYVPASVPPISPDSPVSWRASVRERLDYVEPAEVRLSDLVRWKIKSGNDLNRPSGSNLRFEHFLHFRALVKNHVPDKLTEHIKQYVDEKHIFDAKNALDDGHFHDYLKFVPNSNPDVEYHGRFAAAKVAQNEVVHAAFRKQAFESPSDKSKGKQQQQLEPDSEDEDMPETPLRAPRAEIGVPIITYQGRPKNENVASQDEMIVNLATVNYLSALCRPSLKGGQSSRKRVLLGDPEHTTLARWTIGRNRFVIKERARAENEESKKGKQPAKKVDPWIRVLGTETDGHLYDAVSGDILALIEVKSRTRVASDQGCRIEWQETAECLAWLNLRLREDTGRQGPKSERRGLLKSGLGAHGETRYRSLLIAQDRDEIYVVVAEWDDLYEQYAKDGYIGTPSGPSGSAQKREGKVTKAIKNMMSPGGRKPQAPLQNEPRQLTPEDDLGFMMMNVYGPFVTSDPGQMKDASRHILAMAMYLAQGVADPVRRTLFPGSGRPQEYASNNPFPLPIRGREPAQAARVPPSDRERSGRSRGRRDDSQHRR